MKVLRPELADNPEFRVRFGREVTMLTRVQGVCTVRVIEADTQAPKPFLVTEYADGPSLSEYIDTRGPLDAGMLYGLATGLAEALAAIHAAGIVHRDLKPSNVLLTAGGPKVIDFGIAQALDTTSLTRTGITVGSAGYMAPEQVIGKAGTAADIFTWAVTIAYAASGHSPFGTGAPDAILYRIMHAAPDISAVPPGLHPLVEAAVAKDPQARPTAQQLLSQLTHTAARPSAGYDNPTQIVLAQTWHPSATGPPGPRRVLPCPCPGPVSPCPRRVPLCLRRVPRRPPGSGPRAAARSCSQSCSPWRSCWPPRALRPVSCWPGGPTARTGPRAAARRRPGRRNAPRPPRTALPRRRPPPRPRAPRARPPPPPPPRPRPPRPRPRTTPATTTPATTTPATTTPATTTPATTTPATTRPHHTTSTGA